MPRPRPVRLRAALALAFVALGGCIAASSSRFGGIVVVTQGDVNLEDGLKDSEVADGWAVSFERFVVNVGGVAVGASATTTSTLGESTYVLVDQAQPGPKVVITASDVVARSWPSFAFTVRPARQSSELAGGATEADLGRMSNVGASMWVKGSARKGGVTKTFDWFFTHTVAYEACKVTTASGTVFGIEVEDDETTEVSLVYRGRTLFEDGIAVSKPSLRFAPFAEADTNADGIVASNELSAMPLTTVRTNHGFYGTSSYTSVVTLRDYLDVQARRVVVFQGNGSCTPRRL